MSLDRRTGRYSLGFGLIDLAGQAGGASMVQTAHAVLARIAGETGETAALAVMRDGALTYVAEAVAGAIVSVTWQGRPVSLHATSTGKVLLAFSGRRRGPGAPEPAARRAAATLHLVDDHLPGGARRRAGPHPRASATPSAGESSTSRPGGCPLPCSTPRADRSP